MDGYVCGKGKSEKVIVLYKVLKGEVQYNVVQDKQKLSIKHLILYIVGCE
jgi:hypothetical protein